MCVLSTKEKQTKQRGGHIRQPYEATNPTKMKCCVEASASDMFLSGAQAESGLRKREMLHEEEENIKIHV